MVKSPIFKDFSEWWYYARILTEDQRSVIFDNLPKPQKEDLESSYNKEGWEDVFCHNEIDILIDKLKEKYKYDMIDIRYKVLRGKSVYLPLKFWRIFQNHMDEYKPDSVKFLMSGIKAVSCKVNEEVVLLISEAANTSDIID